MLQSPHLGCFGLPSQQDDGEKNLEPRVTLEGEGGEMQHGFQGRRLWYNYECRVMAHELGAPVVLHRLPPPEEDQNAVADTVWWNNVGGALISPSARSGTSYIQTNGPGHVGTFRLFCLLDFSVYGKLGKSRDPALVKGSRVEKTSCRSHNSLQNAGRLLPARWRCTGRNCRCTTRAKRFGQRLIVIAPEVEKAGR